MPRRVLLLLLTGPLSCSPGAVVQASPRAPAEPAVESPTRSASPATTPRASSAPPSSDAPATAVVESDAPEPSHPLAGLDGGELERRLLEQPESLGSLSIGTPNLGALFNGVRVEKSELCEPVDPDHTWATQETHDYLEAAVRRVHERFDQTPPLYLGHISARGGRWLSPHRSHQSGRDADIGFYYKSGERWYRRAHRGNLDLPRTWTLVRALVTETDAEMILMDRSISTLLHEYALDLGEDRAWLQWIFRGGNGQKALIRHERGHGTHLHVRFYNPIAQESARRVYPLLVKHEMVREVPEYKSHRVVKGETLGKLAKRYGTTVLAIKRANGLRSSLIQAKKTYRIPVPPGQARTSAPLEFPRRRLPPGPQPEAGADGETGENLGG